MVIAATSDNITLLESFLRLNRSFFVHGVTLEYSEVKWLNDLSHGCTIRCTSEQSGGAFEWGL